MADWKEAQETTPVLEPEHWVIHFDGSNLLHGSGAGVTLKSPKGDGTYKARNEVMVAYMDEVDEMAKSFLGYDIKHVR
jgi:hypothetical protein